MKLKDPNYPGKVERAILFSIDAWDVNCPQHIHKRFPEKVVTRCVKKLQIKIKDLEQAEIIAIIGKLYEMIKKVEQA